MPRRIVMVGEVMLDVLGPPPEDGRVHAPVTVRAGGSAVTAALAARAAGAEVTVVGRVGDDAAAAAVRSTLDAAGVGAMLAVDPDLPTGAFVQLGGAIVASRGANARLGVDDVPAIDADAVLVSGYLLMHDDTRAAARRALSCAAPLRAVIATPFADEDFVRGARGANVLFADAAEADRLGGAGRLAPLFDVVCITHAADGATLYRHGRSGKLAPSGVAGTGAGDAFAGTLIVRL